MTARARQTILSLPQIVGSDRLDALGTQVLGDLPVPHRQRAELGSDQQDRQADGLKSRHAPIGLTQHLRKDHGLGLGNLVPERHRFEELNVFGQQRTERRQLLVEIVVPAWVQIEWNESCFHDVVLFTGVMVGWPAVSGWSQYTRPNRGRTHWSDARARAICSSSHGSATVLKSNIPK